MGLELSIVIPTYNEEGNIEFLYSELKGVLLVLGRSHEIIFIDDGSKDGTLAVLKKIREQDNNIKIIKFRKNFGQSAALKAGFDYASGNIIISMDADLQNDPKDIPLILKKMESEDYDVVCGWRYNRQDSSSKKIFSKIANKLRRWLTQEKIHDSGCTLRSYKNECVKNLDLYGELHRYIPAILQWKGYRISEIQVIHKERFSGTSKYSWKRIFNGFLDLMIILFWQKYSVRPMHFFGGIGLIFIFFGFVIDCVLVFERLFYNMGLTDRPLFLVGLILVVIGFQFIALGIIADILLKIYYGQNERKNYLVDRESK
jgi:glycosyltransferase involved in cell wall biosynthesis